MHGHSLPIHIQNHRGMAKVLPKAGPFFGGAKFLHGIPPMARSMCAFEVFYGGGDRSVDLGYFHTRAQGIWRPLSVCLHWASITLGAFVGGLLNMGRKLIILKDWPLSTPTLCLPKWGGVDSLLGNLIFQKKNSWKGSLLWKKPFLIEHTPFLITKLVHTKTLL